jgi:hypothetical protein
MYLHLKDKGHVSPFVSFILDVQSPPNVQYNNPAKHVIK